MRQTLKKYYIIPFKNLERSKNKTKKNGGDSHDRIKSLSKEIGVSKDFLDYSNQTNTNLPNIVIPTNSTKQASKNIRHEPNNNIACNQNHSVNIDIPTKLNINIFDIKNSMSTYLKTLISIYLSTPKISHNRPTKYHHTNKIGKEMIAIYFMNKTQYQYAF